MSSCAYTPSPSYQYSTPTSIPYARPFQEAVKVLFAPLNLFIEPLFHSLLTAQKASAFALSCFALIKEMHPTNRVLSGSVMIGMTLFNDALDCLSSMKRFVSVNVYKPLFEFTTSGIMTFAKVYLFVCKSLFPKAGIALSAYSESVFLSASTKIGSDGFTKIAAACHTFGVKGVFQTSSVLFFLYKMTNSGFKIAHDPTSKSYLTFIDSFLQLSLTAVALTSLATPFTVVALTAVSRYVSLSRASYGMNKNLINTAC